MKKTRNETLNGVKVHAPWSLDRALKWIVFIGIGAVFIAQAVVFVHLRASFDDAETVMREVLP